jgi:pyruvate formate lyase activating enzyme
MADELGPQVPLHFSAFHPDWKMRDVRATPPATLKRARQIALGKGLRYVYTGNVFDPDGQSTWCHGCGACLIGRKGYTLTSWLLDAEGRCAACGTMCGGVLEAKPGSWGSRRESVRLAEMEF